jgi:hypothetical protein
MSFIIIIFFYKIEEQEGRTDPVWEVWHQWKEGRMWGKGVGG